jgi:leucyl aminopeptidase
MQLVMARDIPATVGAVVQGVFDGEAPVGVDPAFARAAGFEGKADQVAFAPGVGPVQVLVGLGARANCSTIVLRRAAALGARAARANDEVACTLLAAAGDTDRGAAAEAIAEGIVLGAYRFRRYKSGDDPVRTVRTHVVGSGGQRIADRLAVGQRIAEGVSLARDLVNEPGGSLTPAAFAQVAVEVAEREDLQITVWDESDLAEAGLGGLLGVNRGSVQPPRLVELCYQPDRPRGSLAMVGKGITFDSGGLSIKSGEAMMAMKNDMSGAAAVLGAFSALAAVRPRCVVRGYLPLTDNMGGGDATRPGDVLRLRNGTTVEVLNTDAEGRLVLGDALALAAEASPDAIVDLATLTGAVEVALGNRIAAVLGRNEEWVGAVEQAATVTGERVWRLPLPDDYRPWLDSDVADLRNISKIPKAGTVTAALFLREFVPAGLPWAHLDIAGTAWSTETRGVDSVGGTGWGVRLLVELARRFQRPARPG